ncbi:hypothetical protein HMPREF9412_6477 [Paenibacillus sp. HGF5]|nr:hypothetical protein HMPREF9412_6477 [Paenibacillus sp. HGF5]
MRMVLTVLGAFKGLAHWFLKPRRRYTSNKKVERIVDIIFRIVLLIWAFFILQWFVGFIYAILKILFRILFHA